MKNSLRHKCFREFGHVNASPPVEQAEGAKRLDRTLAPYASTGVETRAKQSPHIEDPEDTCYRSAMLCAKTFGTVQK